jgi:hypothetical protein
MAVTTYQLPLQPIATGQTKVTSSLDIMSTLSITTLYSLGQELLSLFGVLD